MKHELLSPAGTYETCMAVLAAGADAVYLAGESFGARAYAGNLSSEEIIAAIDTAHLYGKRIYLAVNTLLKNTEIENRLYDMLLPLYEAGLDAVIIQDAGVLYFIRKYFPGLAVHASTQMSVCSKYGAGWLKEQGVSRIVAARELGSREIRRIHEETGIEIECFVHGALCYCYSGHCLMSSLIGGRSGNRGRCAQPCRLRYMVAGEDGHTYRKKDAYPLSMKDLCAVSILPELMNAGIFSFKIEGRMKQTRYAAGVTAIYRKYIDLAEGSPEDYKVSSEDQALLEKLGSRGSFTEGYYRQRSGREMLSSGDPSHCAGDALTDVKYTLPPIRADIKAVFKKDTPSRIDISARGHTVTAYGASPQSAKKSPVSVQDIKKHLGRSGGSGFKAADISVISDENIFIPVGNINELRRRAFLSLKESMLSGYRRNAPLSDAGAVERERDAEVSDRGRPGRPELLVRISSKEALDSLLGYEFIDEIEIDFNDELDISLEKIHSRGIRAGICLPHIMRESTSRRLKQIQDTVLLFDTVTARNYDELGLLDKWGLKKDRIRLSHSLYVYSEPALRAFEESGYVSYDASQELSKAELSHMRNDNAAFMAYGYQPLMVSAQCIYNNYAGCRDISGGGKLHLIDRRGCTLNIDARCSDCYNLIYNSVPLCLLHRPAEIMKLSPGCCLLSFTFESDEEIRSVMSLYEAAFISKSDNDTAAWGKKYTNGHFTRGVR